MKALILTCKAITFGGLGGATFVIANELAKRYPAHGDVLLTWACVATAGLALLIFLPSRRKEEGQ